MSHRHGSFLSARDRDLADSVLLALVLRRPNYIFAYSLVPMTKMRTLTVIKSLVTLYLTLYSPRTMVLDVFHVKICDRLMRCCFLILIYE